MKRIITLSVNISYFKAITYVIECEVQTLLSKLLFYTIQFLKCKLIPEKYYDYSIFMYYLKSGNALDILGCINHVTLNLSVGSNDKFRNNPCILNSIQHCWKAFMTSVYMAHFRSTNSCKCYSDRSEFFYMIHYSKISN